jgi:hypothetical protein
MVLRRIPVYPRDPLGPIFGHILLDLLDLWFVSIKPIHACDEFIQQDHVINRKQEFWSWCQKNCQGTIMCFSSSDDEEWWGFGHQADVAWWLLKWS